MIKKTFLQFCIAVILLGTNLSSVQAINIETIPNQPTPTTEVSDTGKVTGTLILPDNEIHPPVGTNGYEKDREIIEYLIATEGKELGHTGFSAKEFIYLEEPVEINGKLTHWVEGDYYSTDHGFIDRQDYRAIDFTAEQLGVSESEYQRLVDTNAKINITIDSREDGDRGQYSKYIEPTKEQIAEMLARGEVPKAFYYKNNDVKLNFSFTPPPPYPSGERTEIVYVPPTWGTGNVSWGMFKDTLNESGSSDTKIKWTNGLVAGSHFADFIQYKNHSTPSKRGIKADETC